MCGACTGTIESMPGASNPDGTPVVNPRRPNPPGTGGSSGTPGTPPGMPGALGGGSTQMRRLNVAEYQATIKDWLGITVDTSDFPLDGATHAGLDTVSSVLAISPTHVENFESAADSVITALFGPDPGGIRATWCGYKSGNAAADETCVGQIVSNFAEQAWRRPHGTWAGNEGVATYQGAIKSTGRFGMFPLEMRLQAALKSILLGPRFLLRVEITDTNGRLDTPSLASRLSYMLWGTAPDVKALKTSNLRDDAALLAELNRMRADSTKFARFAERFPDLWLQIGQVDKLKRDPAQFPKFSPALAKAMRDETSAFFGSFMGTNGAKALPLQKLLAHNPASTDPALQSLYGNSPRLGLLTQASVLSVTSSDRKTSAVRRGHWVMERLLCDPPPPPPEALNGEIQNQVMLADQTASERVRLAQHRADPKCAACHVTMDAIGLGLENYDPIGEYRLKDSNNREIDASGALPGSTEKFTNATELATLLSKDNRFLTCVASQLLTYGTGSDHTSVPHLDSIIKTAGGAEATFQKTLEAVVLSPAFRSREGSN